MLSSPGAQLAWPKWSARSAAPWLVAATTSSDAWGHRCTGQGPSVLIFGMQPRARHDAPPGAECSPLVACVHLFAGATCGARAAQAMGASRATTRTRRPLLGIYGDEASSEDEDLKAERTSLCVDARGVLQPSAWRGPAHQCGHGVSDGASSACRCELGLKSFDCATPDDSHHSRHAYVRGWLKPVRARLPRGRAGGRRGRGLVRAAAVHGARARLQGDRDPSAPHLLRTYSLSIH